MHTIVLMATRAFQRNAVHFLDAAGCVQVAEKSTELFGDQAFILTEEMPYILLEKVYRLMKS